MLWNGPKGGVLHHSVDPNSFLHHSKVSHLPTRRFHTCTIVLECSRDYLAGFVLKILHRLFRLPCKKKKRKRKLKENLEEQLVRKCAKTANASIFLVTGSSIWSIKSWKGDCSCNFCRKLIVGIFIFHVWHILLKTYEFLWILSCSKFPPLSSAISSSKYIFYCGMLMWNPTKKKKKHILCTIPKTS